MLGCGRSGWVIKSRGNCVIRRAGTWSSTSNQLQLPCLHVNRFRSSKDIKSNGNPTTFLIRGRDLALAR